ncbi:MAG: hypothetical protein OXC31_15600, partial [Spirochaetaceae bacterium]|nr:hypothetical protein [Spirochaetaceae bacterium]
NWIGDAISGTHVTTGSNVAYRIETLYADDMDFGAGIPNWAAFSFRPHVACGNGPTLRIKTQAVKDLVWPDGSSLAENQIGPANVVTAVHVSATGKMVVVKPTKPTADGGMGGVDENAVNALIAAKLLVGAPIDGKLLTWGDREPYTAGTVAGLGAGQWMQSLADPADLYVGADALTEAYLRRAASATAIKVGNAVYALAAAPTVHTAAPANGNAVMRVQVANLPAQGAGVEALTVRVGDKIIGDRDVRALVGDGILAGVAKPTPASDKFFVVKVTSGGVVSLAEAVFRRYVTPGNYQFTVPAGVTTLKAIMAGADGGGGGGGGSGGYAHGDVDGSPGGGGAAGVDGGPTLLTYGGTTHRANGGQGGNGGDGGDAQLTDGGIDPGTPGGRNAGSTASQTGGGAGGAAGSAEGVPGNDGVDGAAGQTRTVTLVGLVAGSTIDITVGARGAGGSGGGAGYHGDGPETSYGLAGTAGPNNGSLTLRMG